MKTTKIFFAALLTTLGTLNVSAQLVNNADIVTEDIASPINSDDITPTLPSNSSLSNNCQLDASFSYTLDSTTCTYTFSANNPVAGVTYSWSIDGQSRSGSSTTYQQLYDRGYYLSVQMTASEGVPNSHSYCTNTTSALIPNVCSLYGPCDLDAACTITLDTANCLYTFTIDNPSSLPNVVYQWGISGLWSATGTQVQYAFPLSHQQFQVNLRIYRPDNICSLHNSFVITPICGLYGNCQINTSFNYTFDSTTCTYSFAANNPVAGVDYYWSFGNNQHYSGFTASFQPLYSNSTFTASLEALRFVPSAQIYCTRYTNAIITNPCGLYGPCNLDNAYTITLDSATCEYIFTVNNPSNLPNVVYRWTIGHWTFTGTSVRFRFPHAHQALHSSLHIYTPDYLCTSSQNFIFTPTCGTDTHCNDNILSFVATADSVLCEATIALAAPFDNGINYNWNIPTVNVNSGGISQSGSQAFITFPTPYFGEYPVSLNATVANGCVVDTVLYFNSTCGAMPRACYLEPAIIPHYHEAMVRWFTVDNIDWANTYHWDFGDGTDAVLDSSLHHLNNGMTHRYNAFGVYRTVLTVTTPTCTNTYEHMVTMGSVTSTETAAVKDEVISLYPNPAKAILNLQLGSNISTPLILEIFNIEGQCVRSENINSELATIDISNLNDGVYVLRLIDNNAQSIGTKRFVVMK